MKKLVLLMCAMTISSMSYGMDIGQEITGRYWRLVATRIREADKTGLPKLIEQLVDAQTKDLNEIGFTGDYLFDVLLRSAFNAGQQPSSAFEDTNEILVLKEFLKHDKVDPNPPREGELMPRLQALSDEVCQKANDEKAAKLAAEQQQAANAAAKKAQIVNKVFKQRCMIFIPIAVAIIALAYVVYRWKTQKVDKAAQEEDANQDTGHAVV